MAIGTRTEYTTIYKANANPTAAMASNEQIDFALESANGAVERFCGIAFTNSGNTQQTFTAEKLNGTGTPFVRVKNVPIVSITSVAILGDDGSSTTLDSSSYRFDAQTGTISLVGSQSSLILSDSFGSLEESAVDYAPSFPVGFGNVSVTYLGGYTTAPADLRWALYELVDELLAGVGIRGTGDWPGNVDAMVRARAVRFGTFQRIVC